MMRKKKATEKKLSAKQRDNRIRAGFAAGWLLCVLALILMYGPFCPEGMTLTYALLSAGIPPLAGVQPPQYGVPESEETPDERVTIDRADVDAGVGNEIRIEIAKREEADPKLDLSGTEPRILIYHGGLTAHRTRQRHWLLAATNHDIIFVQ